MQEPLVTQLRVTLSLMPAHTWYAAPSGALIFVNERWGNYLGLADDHPLRLGAETGALPITQIPLHPDDREEVSRVWAASLKSGSSAEASFRVRNSRGIYRWFLGRSDPLRGSDGAILGWIGINLEIEDRKQVELHLAEGQRLAQMGSWAFNASGFEYWSYELFKIYGLDPAGKAPSIPEYLALTHPDDRESVRQEMERMLSQPSRFDFTKRIVRPDGAIRRIRCVGSPAFHDGIFQGLVGTGIDVTEQEQLSEALRNSEERFRLVVDGIDAMVAVLTPEGEVEFVNHQTLDYYGKTLEELKRWQTSDAIHPDEREDAIAVWNNAVRIGQPYEVDHRLRRADGVYRWFRVRGRPSRDGQDRVRRWYIVLTDIEERKNAERKLEEENVALRDEIDKSSMFEEIVGASPALAAVLTRGARVAGSDSTVLISGETGTGKELVARAIHRRSQRASRPFVAVNCAAIPRDLIASELFGHERGAFTGAVQRRLGRFELADGGTLFLDEVSELSLEIQVALLRVLQEREFERVGGTQTIRADVRVIAATNRDLTAAIDSRVFRLDLFYRLNVFPLVVPPLRERREDIPLLVRHFIDRYARKAGKSIRRLNRRALDHLRSYPWPGNVRELENVIERSVIVCDTDEFTVDESWLSTKPAIGTRLKLSSSMAAHERTLVEDALRATGGRVFGPSGAAARLGIPRSTLESKIRALKINKSRFRFRAG